jgi:hypothetical protein
MIDVYSPYHRLIIFEELFSLIFKSAKASIVILLATVLFLLSVFIDVGTGILLQPFLLFMLVHFGLRESDIHGDGCLSDAGEHWKVCPLIFIIIVLNCYYHIYFVYIIYSASFCS